MKGNGEGEGERGRGETPATPYDMLGGEVELRALVDRFYDLMDLEADYAVIRKLHPTDLAHSREKLFMFLSGWLGRAGARSRGPACGDATVKARTARGIRRAIARSGVAPTPFGRRHCSARRGRPGLYAERYGHPMLRARHLPFAIGVPERDRWMQCMIRAMEETGVEDRLREVLAQAFFGTADWMRNQAE